MATGTTEKHRPICGKEVTDSTLRRFGEWICSEAHGDEYLKEVRAQKLRTMAWAAQEEGRRPRQMCGG